MSAAVRLAVVGIGMATPLGRTPAEHCAWAAADTSLGLSGCWLGDDGGQLPLLACEWLRPGMTVAQRMAALAQQAAHSALADGATADALDGGPLVMFVGPAAERGMDESALQFVMAAVCERLGLSAAQAWHCGSAGLVMALRAAGKRLIEGGRRRVLIVAVDSFFDHERLRRLRAVSPWELPARPPSEGAAALLLAAAEGDPTDERSPLGHIFHIDDITGPPLPQRRIVGAALTQLLAGLPTTLRAAAICGPFDRSLDHQLGWQYAQARSHGWHGAIAADAEHNSLAQHVHELGAAAMTAELCYALARHVFGPSFDTCRPGMDSPGGDHLEARDTHPVLIWEMDEDGRRAVCSVLPHAGAQLNTVAALNPSGDAAGAAANTNAINPSHANLSAVGALPSRVLVDSLGDLAGLARARYERPLADQPELEKRLAVQLRACMPCADQLDDMLGEAHAPPDASPLRDEANNEQPATPWRTWALIHALASCCPGALPRWLAHIESIPQAIAAAEALAMTALRDDDLASLADNRAAAPYAVAMEALRLRRQCHPAARDTVAPMHAPVLAPGLISVLAELIDDLPRLPQLLKVVALRALADDTATCSETTPPHREGSAAAHRFTPLQNAAAHRFTPLQNAAIVQTLHHCLADDHPAIAQHAAIALACRGESEWVHQLHNSPELATKLDVVAMEAISLFGPMLLTRTKEAPYPPATPRMLLALGRSGHPGVWQRLCGYLDSGHLGDAAQAALETLFGPAPQRADADGWREHIAALRLDADESYRRGRPWSPAVVASEIESGALCRAAIQWRLRELRVRANIDWPQLPLWAEAGILTRALAPFIAHLQTTPWNAP